MKHNESPVSSESLVKTLIKYFSSPDTEELANQQAVLIIDQIIADLSNYYAFSAPYQYLTGNLQKITILQNFRTNLSAKEKAESSEANACLAVLKKISVFLEGYPLQPGSASTDFIKLIFDHLQKQKYDDLNLKDSDLENILFAKQGKQFCDELQVGIGKAKEELKQRQLAEKQRLAKAQQEERANLDLLHAMRYDQDFPSLLPYAAAAQTRNVAPPLTPRYTSVLGVANVALDILGMVFTEDRNQSTENDRIFLSLD